jgi:hypothetical protein
MAFALLTVARDYFADKDAFLGLHPYPWLVWDLGKPSQEPIIAPTLSHGGKRSLPSVGEPLAIPVQKGKAASFVLGITFGRTENNDVVLRHEEVSRFHAYVTGGSGGLALIDADSKNGTFVDGTRLVPTRPRLLPDTCLLRFGELGVRYFSAAAFARYLENA